MSAAIKLVITDEDRATVQRRLLAIEAAERAQRYVEARCALTARQIIRFAASIWDVQPRDITGPWQSREFVLPRHAAMWAVRQTLPMSLPRIGRIFGDRDHTTVLHAIRAVDRRRDRDRDFRAATDGLLKAATIIQETEGLSDEQL